VQRADGIAEVARHPRAPRASRRPRGEATVVPSTLRDFEGVIQFLPATDNSTSVVCRGADSTYTVSGARDHYREQSRAGGFLLERVPEFNNFFSEIPTHPSQTFRCAGPPVPFSAQPERGCPASTAWALLLGHCTRGGGERGTGAIQRRMGRRARGTGGMRGRVGRGARSAGVVQGRVGRRARGEE